MSLNELPDPPDEGGPQKTRKKSQDDTMITVSLTEAEWCDLFIDLGHSLKSRLPHLPRDIRIIKAFAHLRGLCANSVALDSLNSFQEKYYRQEASSATQRRKHSRSGSPGTIDTTIKYLLNREAPEEYLDVVGITEKLDRSIASLSIEPNTGLEPFIKTNGGKPVVDEQIFCHSKSVLFLDEHEPDSEKNIEPEPSVPITTPAAISDFENSDCLQAENIRMANEIEHRMSEPASPTTSTIIATSREVPNGPLASKTLSGSLTLPLAKQADSLINPTAPPTPPSPYTDTPNQLFSLSPNESPMALRLEGFSPILSTVKENHLAEDRWRDSQVYGGALEEYLAPLPRHSLIDGVGNAKVTVTTPLELSSPGWTPEVTLSSPPSQTTVFSSPSSICTTSTRSGIPRSTATFGKDKEIPLAPPTPITAKKLILKTLNGKETSSYVSRAKGAKAESPQPKPGLMKTLRASSGGGGTTSNISKLLTRKTYPTPENEISSKEKTIDPGRFTSLRSTSAIPTPRVIDRSLLAKDGNNRKLPVEKMLENARPELGTKPKTVAPLIPINPHSPNIAPTTKFLPNKPPTSAPVHQRKLAPGYIIDKRGTRTSITSSLLSSPKRRFNSVISIYEDMPLLREDSSSTLLSAASNSSENIGTMVQAEYEFLTTAGFSKGSPKLVEVSKDAMGFGISLGSGHPQCKIRRPPSRVFSKKSITTVPECGEEDALLLSPLKAVSETTNPAGRQNSLYSAGECLGEAHDKSCVLEAEDVKIPNSLRRPAILQENGEYQPSTSQPLAPFIEAPPNERTNAAAANASHSSPSHGRVLSRTHQRTASTGSNKTTGSTSTTTSTSASGSSTTVKAARPRYSRNSAIAPSKIIPTKPPENPKAATKNGNLSSTKKFLRRGSGIKTKSSFNSQAADLDTALMESADPNPSGLDANSTVSSHDAIRDPKTGNKLGSTNERARNRINPPSGEWLARSDHYKGNTAKGDSRTTIEQETSVSTNSKPSNTILTKRLETHASARVSQNHLAEGPLRNGGNQTLPRVPPIENLPGKGLTATRTQALADISAIGSNRNPRTLPSPGRNWFGRRSLVSAPTSGAVYGKENYNPSSSQQGTTPVNKEKVKSRSLGNLAGWLHRSPKMSPDGLFSRGAKKEKDKFSKAASSLVASSTLATLTLQPLGYHEKKAEFSHNDVGNLIKRLSIQSPSTPNGSSGFSALGGKYYTSGYIPNLDESPSKESNPIAICMDLINSASEEAQSPRRERLLQISSIMVDAVSKSRDAECAAEEAKIAAAKAECAFLETRKSLQAMTELLKKMGKDVLCDIIF